MLDVFCVLLFTVRRSYIRTAFYLKLLQTSSLIRLWIVLYKLFSDKFSLIVKFVCLSSSASGWWRASVCAEAKWLLPSFCSSTTSRSWNELPGPLCKFAYWIMLYAVWLSRKMGYCEWWLPLRVQRFCISSTKLLFYMKLNCLN